MSPIQLYSDTDTDLGMEVEIAGVKKAEGEGCVSCPRSDVLCNHVCHFLASKEAKCQEFDDSLAWRQWASNDVG